MADRAVPRTSAALPVPGLLDRAKRQDVLQGEFPAGRDPASGPLGAKESGRQTRQGLIAMPGVAITADVLTGSHGAFPACPGNRPRLQPARARRAPPQRPPPPGASSAAGPPG